MSKNKSFPDFLGRERKFWFGVASTERIATKRTGMAESIAVKTLVLETWLYMIYLATLRDGFTQEESVSNFLVQ